MAVNNSSVIGDEHLLKCGCIEGKIEISGHFFHERHISSPHLINKSCHSSTILFEVFDKVWACSHYDMFVLFERHGLMSVG